MKGQLGLGNFDNVGSPSLVYCLLPFGNSNSKAKSHSGKIKESSDRNLGFSGLMGERKNSYEAIIEQLKAIKDKNNNICEFR